MARYSSVFAPDWGVRWVLMAVSVIFPTASDHIGSTAPKTRFATFLAGKAIYRSQW